MSVDKDSEHPERHSTVKHGEDCPQLNAISATLGATAPASTMTNITDQASAAQSSHGSWPWLHDLGAVRSCDLFITVGKTTHLLLLFVDQLLLYS